MATFAEKRFRLEGRLARMCLCFFVSGSWKGTFDDYRVRFDSWYAAYVVLTTTAMLVFEGFLMVRRIQSVTQSVASSFFETLYTALRLIVAVKVLVTFVVVNMSTETVVQTLRAIKRLEMSIGFHLRGEQGHGYFWFKHRARVAVYATVLLALAVCRGVVVLEVTRDFGNRNALLMSAISVIFFVYYEVMSTLATRLEKYVCVVLSCYLKFQVDGAQRTLISAHVTGDTRDAVQAVEGLRTSLAAVTAIVRKVDKHLRSAVVVNFLCSAIAMCVVVYAAFDTRITTGKLLFTALYATFTTVDVVDATLSAGDIRAQVMGLKALLESASTLALSPRVSRQVELLATTIDEGRFCFTGSGFFAVDRSMLTSFVAVVMTYSLILVQSGRKSDAPLCGC